MKTILTVLTGSRLHGLNRPDSDYDWRGVFMHPLIEVLSPFTKIKNTSWIEGKEDNTSFELASFAKQAVHGNCTILEILFSDKVKKSTPVADEMRDNRYKFMDAEKFTLASKGYAHNQINKFYEQEDKGIYGQNRTSKFAVAFLRTMWQCENFLLTGEFKCSLVESDLFPLMRKIKPLSAEDIKPFRGEIMAAMDKMYDRVSKAQSESAFMDMKPDIPWIESFLERSYVNQTL
jgi:predicted nucleotidyltransferase